MTSDQHPKPAVTVDILVLSWDGTCVSILLVRRGSEPYKGCWALPGGFMEIDETLQQAALRELEEETGVRPDGVLPGPVFDSVQRDPRGRVLSVPYVAVVLAEDIDLKHGSDASDARFFQLSSLPVTLAFDHLDIIAAVCPIATSALLAGRLVPSLSGGERERIAGIIERDAPVADDATMGIY